MVSIKFLLRCCNRESISMCDQNREKQIWTNAARARAHQTMKNDNGHSQKKTATTQNIYSNEVVRKKNYQSNYYTHTKLRTHTLCVIMVIWLSEEATTLVQRRLPFINAARGSTCKLCVFFKWKIWYATLSASSTLIMIVVRDGWIRSDRPTDWTNKQACSLLISPILIHIFIKAGFSLWCASILSLALPTDRPTDQPRLESIHEWFSFSHVVRASIWSICE